MLEEAKYKNIFRGITISVVVTVIAYIIISIISVIVLGFIWPGFFLFADLQFSLGTVFGVYYFIKTRQPDQSILKYGVIIGIVGGMISAFFISLYQILLLDSSYFLGYLLGGLISGVFVGFLIGVIICVYFMYKEVKEERPEKHYDDDFFKDLIED